MGSEHAGEKKDWRVTWRNACEEHYSANCIPSNSELVDFTCKAWPNSVLSAWQSWKVRNLWYCVEVRYFVPLSQYAGAVLYENGEEKSRLAVALTIRRRQVVWKRDFCGNNLSTVSKWSEMKIERFTVSCEQRHRLYLFPLLLALWFHPWTETVGQKLWMRGVEPYGRCLRVIGRHLT